MILGVDECGTGSWVGPLVVCGVKTENSWSIPGLNDSKKLTKSKREKLAQDLEKEISKGNVVLKIQEGCLADINFLGMGATLHYAYIELISKFYEENLEVILDGTLKLATEYPYKSVIKADSKYPSVMAASIYAKVYRDNLILELHKLDSRYGWEKNAGYGTKDHIAALDKYGVSDYHRKSYEPIKKRL
jgi:ribonuclease HII